MAKKMTEEIKKYLYEQCSKHDIATVPNLPFESKEEVDQFIEQKIEWNRNLTNLEWNQVTEMR